MTQTPRDIRLADVVRVVASSLDSHVGGVTVVQISASALVVRYQARLYRLTITDSLAGPAGTAVQGSAN